MLCFLNPGHAPNGNPDPGACNAAMGLRESDIAAEIGELVAGYLNAAGVETRLLQSDDLGEICEAANDSGADIFVSIHCNAFNGTAHGTETCVFGLDGEGAILGEQIQAQIVDSLGTTDRGLKERPGLYVLKHTDMPAVLVETAFIDNGSDGELLRDKADEFARAIARGVTDYQIIKGGN